MFKKIFLFLALIILISSIYVFAQQGEAGEATPGDIKECQLPKNEVDPNSQTKTDTCKLPQETPVTDQQGIKIGRIPLGEQFSVMPGSGLSASKIITDEANEYTNVQNLRTENGNIIADAFTFEAKQPAELSVMNPIDNTKLRFDVPAGTIIKIEKDGPFFKIINTGDINLDILSKCSPIFYSSIGGSELQIEQSSDGNSLYTFRNGALEFNSNNKKQLLRTDEISKAEIGNDCNGFVCFDLGTDAKFDYEESLNSFYLENPETGKDYEFCFEKKQGDGYKLGNSFILDKAIKLFNYKKDKVYLGIDQNNQVSFTTQDGIITNFVLKNKAPSQQLIARLWPSKSFELREEKEHSYLTLLNQLPEYTAIENYELDLISNSPLFWIKDDVLYQDNKEGKLGRALPINNQEFAKLVAKLTFKKIKINEILKQWENEI